MGGRPLPVGSGSGRVPLFARQLVDQLFDRGIRRNLQFAPETLPVGPGVLQCLDSIARAGQGSDEPRHRATIEPVRRYQPMPDVRFAAVMVATGSESRGGLNHLAKTPCGSL